MDLSEHENKPDINLEIDSRSALFLEDKIDLF